jgi:ribonuclease J
MTSDTNPNQQPLSDSPENSGYKKKFFTRTLSSNTFNNSDNSSESFVPKTPQAQNKPFQPFVSSNRTPKINDRGMYSFDSKNREKVNMHPFSPTQPSQLSSTNSFNAFGEKDTPFENNRENPNHNFPRKRQEYGSSKKNFSSRPAFSSSQTKMIPLATANIMSNIPALADGDIRVVPVCGVERIGINMIFVEYKDEIVIIDAGFGIGGGGILGVDYRLPNVTYLRENKHKIKALVITHGHLDHIGGLPYLIEELGFPTIYAREFGILSTKKKFEEYPHLLSKLSFHLVEHNDNYLALSDNLKVKFFGLTHSIPDSTGVILQTPHGGIISTGDVRVESDNGVIHQKEIEQYAIFKDENILLACIDSTGIEKQGWSISEDVVVENVDKIIKETSGRLFITAFSSQIDRILRFVDSAKAHGKEVFFEGRSMKSNTNIAKELKLTDFSHTHEGLEEMANYPDHKIIVIHTGGQGEPFSTLDQVCRGTHKFITLTEKDRIVFSSSVVPGNEVAVQNLKNGIYQKTTNIITYQDNQVHASGHGTREELKWIHQQIPYKFFMPVHGEAFMIQLHGRVANQELGVALDRIIKPVNGSIIEIRDAGKSIHKLPVCIPNDQIIVDGTYIGPMHQVVVDDRTRLSKHGMFVISCVIDPRRRTLKKSPEIASRGFIYLRESRELLDKVRMLVSKTIQYSLQEDNLEDYDELKKIITYKVQKFLFQHTHKEPIVMTLISLS